MRAMSNKSRRKMANPISCLVDVCQRVAWEARYDQGCANPFARSMQMMDVIMIALGLAFFAVSIAYTFACDRL